MKQIELERLKEKIQNELIGKTYAGIFTLISFDGENFIFHDEVMVEQKTIGPLSEMISSGFKDSFLPEFIYEQLRIKLTDYLDLNNVRFPVFKDLYTKEEVILKYLYDNEAECKFYVEYFKKDKPLEVFKLEVLEFCMRFDFIGDETKGT